MKHYLHMEYTWNSTNRYSFESLMARAQKDGSDFFSPKNEAASMSVQLSTTQTPTSDAWGERQNFTTHATITYDEEMDKPVNAEVIGRRSFPVPMH